jgi:hypothetical protein
MDDMGFVRRFTESLRPGAYLRIVSEGSVAAGDEIRVVGRPNHFALVGVLLTAILFVLVKADQYLWILFAVGLAILAAVAGIAWLGRRGRATAS